MPFSSKCDWKHSADAARPAGRRDAAADFLDVLQHSQVSFSRCSSYRPATQRGSCHGIFLLKE